MSVFTILALAMLLDAVFGEPRWLWDRVPHPAVLMGRAVGWLDARWNRGAARRAKGLAALVVLGLGALLAGWMLSMLGGLVSAVAAAVLLAQRSLMDHVRGVAYALRQSLPAGRRAVAGIVGRDTSLMDESEVARAAIESAAENFSDAVIAPVFWFLILGLPGLVLYKAVNTADSMIGYRTDRHEDFGWASARFDDLLNLVPARLSALLVAASGGVLGRWQAIATDAPLHRSPNAGWPEAAVAQALNIALSGPRAYHGARRDYPFVNPAGAHRIGAEEAEQAVRLLWRSWAVLLAGAVLLALLI